MIKAGLTGGIGSGKSTIAKAFATLGAMTYDCDKAARILTDGDPYIASSLKAHFGDGIYADGHLRRKELAKRIFADKEALRLVNSIIHPRVTQDFLSWADKMEAKGEPFVICEAAILFESGMNKVMDKIIVVSLPEEIRIERAMARDHASREQVEARIKNQDTHTAEQCADYLLTPDDKHFIMPQIIQIYKELSNSHQ